MAIELRKHRETNHLSGLVVTFTQFRIAPQLLILRTQAQQGEHQARFDERTDVLVVAQGNERIDDEMHRALRAQIPVISEAEYREILKGSRAGMNNLNRIRFKRQKPAAPKPIKIKPCIIDHIKAFSAPKNRSLSAYVV